VRATLGKSLSVFGVPAVCARIASTIAYVSASQIITLASISFQRTLWLCLLNPELPICRNVSRRHEINTGKKSLNSRSRPLIQSPLPRLPRRHRPRINLEHLGKLPVRKTVVHSMEP